MLQTGTKKGLERAKVVNELLATWRLSRVPDIPFKL